MCGGPGSYLGMRGKAVTEGREASQEVGPL